MKQTTQQPSHKLHNRAHTHIQTSCEGDDSRVPDPHEKSKSDAPGFSSSNQKTEVQLSTEHWEFALAEFYEH